MPDHQSALLTELRNLLNDVSNQMLPLRDLFENLPVSVVYVDSTEVLRIVNREFEKWYAKPRSQLIGRTVREVTGNDENYFAAKKLINAALQGVRASFFLSRHYPDGEHRYIAAYLEPDICSSGKVSGYVGVFCPVPLSSDEAKHIFDDRGFRITRGSPGQQLVDN